MQPWLGYLVVFLGAGIGGAVRHLINDIAPRPSGSGVPLTTLAINVVGSLLIGVLAAIFTMKENHPEALRLLLTTGFLGGFTTFSAFSLEAAMLWQRGQFTYATWYVGGSVVLALGAVGLGLAVGAKLI